MQMQACFEDDRENIYGPNFRRMPTDDEPMSFSNKRSADGPPDTDLIKLPPIPLQTTMRDSIDAYQKAASAKKSKGTPRGSDDGADGG